MIYYCYTNVGKTRNNNEDGLLIKCQNKDLLIYDISLSSVIKNVNECNIFVVSDGMGGTEQGEIATKYLLEYLNRYRFSNKLELENILNQVVLQLQEDRIDGGCAFAGINIIDEKLNIFNVGDCRVYKKVNDYVKRISKDHSVVENMVDAGLLSMQEAHNHPQSNQLTSSIMPYKDFELFFSQIDIQKGDIFLICSDGVWGELDMEELDECFEYNEIDDINNELFLKLSKTTQNDNLTYILLQI